MLRPTRFDHPDRTVIHAAYLILAQLKQKRLVGCKQLLTKVRSFIVTVLSRRLNIRLILLQPLRHQLISQTEQVPTRI